MQEEMNLKEIRSELRKLSALAAEWTSLQEVAPVERDMALEKLRTLYEALRFSAVPRPVVGRVLPERTASEAPRSASRVVVPEVRAAAFDEEDSEFEMVDLSEVLSLGEEEEPEEPVRQEAAAVPESAARQAAEEEEAYDEGPEIIEFDPEPEPPGRVSRPVVAKPEKPRAESVPEPAAEEGLSVVQLVDEPEPEAKAAPQPSAAQQFAPKPSAPQQFAPQSAAPQPSVAQQFAAQSAAAEPSASQPLQAEPAPTLFGPEDEEAERHRRKQRVIRALYEPNPELAETPKTRDAARGSFAGPEKNAFARTSSFASEKPNAAAPATPAAASGNSPAAAPASQPAAAPETSHVVAPAPRSVTAPEEPEAEMVLLDAYSEEPVGTAAEEPRPSGPAPGEAEAHAPQVLGEVMNHDVQTLADTIAPLGSGPARYAAPISDLRQAIGLNDKFLMIRDLFGGDGALFDATVEALNAQESLDDCMIYIAEHFAWNPESDSAALLTELLERKFA